MCVCCVWQLQESGPKHKRCENGGWRIGVCFASRSRFDTAAVPAVWRWRRRPPCCCGGAWLPPGTQIVPTIELRKLRKQQPRKSSHATPGRLIDATDAEAFSLTPHHALTRLRDAVARGPNPAGQVSSKRKRRISLPNQCKGAARSTQHVEGKRLRRPTPEGKSTQQCVSNDVTSDVVLVWLGSCALQALPFDKLASRTANALHGGIA